MARQSQTIEVNQQALGFITEASPLNFPDGATVDEANFNLERDGTRSRRSGIDLIINTPVSIVGTYLENSYATFVWEDVVGSHANEQVILVQAGSHVIAYRLTSGDNLTQIWSKTFVGTSPSKPFGFAQINGKAVVAYGGEELLILDYDGVSITEKYSRLTIRDLFGVEDIYDPTNLDLRSVKGVVFRPPGVLSSAHVYNLRNQTWALPRKPEDNEFLDDPIFRFNIASNPANAFPSNADNLLVALAPMTDDSDDRIGDRFHPKASYTTPPTNVPAPRGFFIIDALNRGESRMEAYQNLLDMWADKGDAGEDALRYPLTTDLPLDKTSGGPLCVEAFSGRIFYAGFSGRVEDGDRHSPNLASYVMFSQIVDDSDKITRCYQEGDPTGTGDPDLVDSDGGMVEITGAVNIKRLLNWGNSLLIFADNGVWSLTGGSNYGFAATNYRVDRLSSNGLLSPGTVVWAAQAVYYWSGAGICSISLTPDGGFEEDNLSSNTIQTYYNSIPVIYKIQAQGAYEKGADKVRWVYYDATSASCELVMDINTGSFAKMRYEGMIGEIV